MWEEYVCGKYIVFPLANKCNNVARDPIPTQTGSGAVVAVLTVCASDSSQTFMNNWPHYIFYQENTLYIMPAFTTKESDIDLKYHNVVVPHYTIYYELNS